MRQFTAKSTIFLVLSLIGAAFAVYSIAIKNYILLVVAILFVFVSADNIFCNLRGK